MVLQKITVSVRNVSCSSGYILCCIHLQKFNNVTLNIYALCCINYASTEQLKELR